MKNVMTYVICVLLVELCGFGVGMMTREGTAIYRDAIAANIQIPYMLWLVFAGYLNLGVWILNR